ncbi:hypothetical protein FRC01_008362 [Tulasnella sp. 417]|nr:hypothetical protein FRC01_008362 [Tulasnella sp. 417]
MPSMIVDLPKEIVLEIAKLMNLKDALNLLRTCKMLYNMTGYRPFWMDQLRRLYFLFQPLLPLQLSSLPISVLREMATKPYCFEQAVLRHDLLNESLLHLKPDLTGDFGDVKVVPGGEWLVTLSTETEDHWQPPAHPFVRLWQITPPVQKALKCVAKFGLPSDHTPLEVCLQPADGPLELLVFVNVYNTTMPLGGSYIQVLRISLAAEDPQFSILAELQTDKFCTGMCLQQGKLFAGIFIPDADIVEAFIWDWKQGGKVEASSQESARVTNLSLTL